MTRENSTLIASNIVSYLPREFFHMSWRKPTAECPATVGIFFNVFLFKYVVSWEKSHAANIMCDIEAALS